MKSIIGVESRRILKKEVFLIFLAVVILLSVSSTCQAVKGYEVWDEGGVVASGRENLKHGKENGKKEKCCSSSGVCDGYGVGGVRRRK